MYKRCVILTLLLFSMITTPPIVISSAAISNTLNETNSLIETQLSMELANNQELGAQALLEFENQLTTSQINEIEATGIQFVRRGSSIVSVGRIYSAIIRSSDSLYAIADIGLIRATSGSKQYTPSLTSSVPTINADDVWTNLEYEDERIDGTGATIAVIDSGAEWLHPSFWRAYDEEFDFIFYDLNYYIDLNRNGLADSNEGPIRSVNGQTGAFFSYSSDYMYISTDGNGNFDYADGDRWVGGIDANDDGQINRGIEKAVILNVSKIAVLYDQFSSNVYVRGVNLTQAVTIGDSRDDGHGTHVASTIAGGQIGMTSYVGVAPGADLIIIRCPFSSADVLDGISFAIENDADVINMSFSSYLGFLDGTDPEDLAISEAFLKYGVLTTAAAGNLGGKSKHARFSVDSGTTSTVRLSVDNEDLNSYLSILWRSSDRDEHIILYPPTGDPIDLGAYSSVAGNAFAISEDALSAYVFCEISPRGMNNIIIQEATTGHDWMDGIWNVVIENPSGDSITVDSYAWDGYWETNHLEFLNQTDNYHTISSPATADYAIAVSSYSESTSSITYSSSRGPRIDGVAKPEISAPGASITAARNSLTSLWWSKDGTSMASPHVAGTLALIIQAEGNGNPWRTYSALVDGAGGLSSHFDDSRNDFGHGLCDAAISVMHVLNETMNEGSSISDWAIVPSLVTDSIDSNISPELDIQSIKVSQEIHAIAFYISTTAAPSFVGSNMLSIEWDTDSNPSTGINGADILVNLTAGACQIYEWNGFSYESSLLGGTWWNVSTSTVVKIDGLDDIIRGSVVVATHNSTMMYIDSASSSAIEDIWHPLINDFELTSQEDTLLIKISAEDRDSSIEDTSLGFSIVDGDLYALNSSIQMASKDIEYAIDSDTLVSGYILSISFNVTSEMNLLAFPPTMLSGSISNLVQFTSAILDRSVVRTGLFINEKITGELQLEAYELASEVIISFQHSSGVWRNFTLSGEGHYEFVISSSGFIPGEYEVFAVAKGTSISTTEMQFATLLVIEDNTLIIVGIVAGIAGLVMIFAVRKMKK